MQAYLDNKIRKDLAKYARNKDFNEYRRTLAKSVRDILTAQLGVFAKSFGSRTPPIADFFLSFHYNSRVLRQWLRVTGDGHRSKDPYRLTLFSSTEIQQWRDVYNWDSKSGHLMVDNRLKRPFVVLFGKSISAPRGTFDWRMKPRAWKDWFAFTRKYLLWFVNRGRKPNSRYEAPKTRDWPSGFALPGFGIWKALRTECERPRRTKEPIWGSKDAATRSFILTFLYSIGAHNEHLTPRDHLVIAVPVLDDARFDEYIATDDNLPDADKTTRRKPKLASLALLCFGRQIWTRYGLTSLQQAMQVFANSLARELAYLEMQLLPEDSRFSTLDEDKMRQACEVDWEKERNGLSTAQLARLDSYSQRWDGLVKDVLKSKTKVDFEAFRKACGFWKKLCTSSKLVGASERYWRVVEDLKQVTLSFVEQAMKDDATDRDSQVVFFYSEPGCGKENLAALVHFMTGLGVLSRIDGKRQLQSDITQLDGDALQAQSKNALAFGTSRPVTEFVQILPKEIILSKSLWETDPFFSYHVTSAANYADRKDFLRSFFGRYSERDPTRNRTGPLLGAHFLRGTVFLDEFNTLADPRWANIFLRLLDKPFECEIPGRRPAALRNISALLICASNWSREELIRRGFNSAVIYRLTKRYFVIPPLRERPVDIAVFVNSKVRDHNKTLLKALRPPLKRIHPDAMRLICELPWPDNYRGVQALLDDVLEQRYRRGISEPVLSFEQVLEGVRRRELLLSQSNHDEPRRKPEIE